MIFIGETMFISADFNQTVKTIQSQTLQYLTHISTNRKLFSVLSKRFTHILADQEDERLYFAKLFLYPTFFYGILIVVIFRIVISLQYELRTYMHLG